VRALLRERQARAAWRARGRTLQWAAYSGLRTEPQEVTRSSFPPGHAGPTMS
jgi:hypothetical protein